MERGLDITINKKTGEITIEGMGYDGVVCQAEIDDIIDAVGGIVLERDSKPEFCRVVGTQTVGGF